MMRRPVWIGLIIFVAAVIGISTLAWASDWDGPDRDHNTTRTIQVTGADGQPLPPNTTVIVNDDGGHRGFRPFFLFPLFFFFGIFLLFRFIFFRERIGPPGWSRGGWNSQTAPPWFDEWHRRSHETSWDDAQKRTHPEENKPAE